MSNAPPKNPFRDDLGRLIIPERASSSFDQRLASAEQKMRTIADDQALADALYDAIPETRHGKVIGTDLARGLLEEYAAGREGRLMYTHATGRVAQAYAKDRFWRELHHRGSRENLLLTAGGVAVGKSTAVTDDVVAEADLVFDGTLRETDWAIEMLNAAIALAWDVAIYYVQRPLSLAIRGAVVRANLTGRWGSLSAIPKTHEAAQRSIVQLSHTFRGRVHFRYWLNDGTSMRTPPSRLTLEQIDVGGKHSYLEDDGLDRRQTEEVGQGRTSRFCQNGGDVVRQTVVEIISEGRCEERVLRLLCRDNGELLLICKSLEDAED